jgi:hypothetical protein
MSALYRFVSFLIRPVLVLAVLASSFMLRAEVQVHASKVRMNAEEECTLWAEVLGDADRSASAAAGGDRAWKWTLEAGSGGTLVVRKGETLYIAPTLGQDAAMVVVATSSDSPPLTGRLTIQVKGRASAGAKEALPATAANGQASGPVEAADGAAGLKAIPGLTSLQEGAGSDVTVRVFRGTFSQPVDHAKPDGPHFNQAFTLLHRSADAPMVLTMTGYELTEPCREVELAGMLQANQVEVEHRFFGTSVPEPVDWGLLNIRQAACDVHALTQALKQVYKGGWISCGHSKGGCALIYHRRFFPCDVAGTFAFGAPNHLEPLHQRYLAFLASRGGAGVAEGLRLWQEAVLKHWEEVRLLFEQEGAEEGRSFNLLGSDRYLQIALLEAPFSLWQYSCDVLAKVVPSANAPVRQLYGYLTLIYLHAGGATALHCDEAFLRLQSYYYQAATELGYTAVADKLHGLPFPGLEDPRNFPPLKVRKDYDPKPMRDIQTWVDQAAERLVLCYGENDPYLAAAFHLTEQAQARDNHRFVVAEGNHDSCLQDMAEANQAKVRALLNQWLGLHQVRPAPAAQEKGSGAAAGMVKP